MIVIKGIILFFIFFSSTLVGILIAKTYKNRVSDLEEMKNALNMLETKMKFTYEPIPEIFKEISNNIKSSLRDIFVQANKNMENNTAGVAWSLALESSKTNMKEEDIVILKRLNKLLGQTDVEGQVSEIELTKDFLDKQIIKAIKEQEKNEKLYKTLGMITGLAIVIILI